MLAGDQAADRKRKLQPDPLEELQKIFSKQHAQLDERDARMQDADIVSTAEAELKIEEWGLLHAHVCTAGCKTVIVLPEKAQLPH